MRLTAFHPCRPGMYIVQHDVSVTLIAKYHIATVIIEANSFPPLCRTGIYSMMYNNNCTAKLLQLLWRLTAFHPCRPGMYTVQHDVTLIAIYHIATVVMEADSFPPLCRTGIYSMM